MKSFSQSNIADLSSEGDGGKRPKNRAPPPPPSKKRGQPLPRQKSQPNAQGSASGEVYRQPQQQLSKPPPLGHKKKTPPTKPDQYGTNPNKPLPSQSKQPDHLNPKQAQPPSSKQTHRLKQQQQQQKSPQGGSPILSPKQLSQEGPPANKVKRPLYPPKALEKSRPLEQQQQRRGSPVGVVRRRYSNEEMEEERRRGRETYLVCGVCVCVYNFVF